MNESFYGVLQNRNIDTVRVGDLEYKTWYGLALYFGSDCKTLGFKYAELDLKQKKVVKRLPEGIWLDKLYVCEHCFKYTDDGVSMNRHRTVCVYATRLPGRIKYRDKHFTIRKIKGPRHEVFCQCLCLFGKLFLDSKSVFFQVGRFDFYVVYGYEGAVQVPMGYFSKEMVNCWDENNLACICVFPPYQNRRLGTLLIEFSYQMSRRQGLVTGPEHPLSVFGRRSYVSFWSRLLAGMFGVGGLFEAIETLSVDEISRFTGFRQDDVITSLVEMGVLRELVEDGSRGAIVIEKSRIVDWSKGKKVGEQVLSPEGLVL